MFIQTEDYLIPCLNKKLFGVECLGCGFQRSVLYLLRGEFAEAFHLYPVIYTLLLFLIFIILNLKFKFKHRKKIIQILAIINILVIVISYIIKINS